MNYRHAFHAGNFADVFKHALLARILVHLTRKPAAIRFIDTHAGIGRYDLAADAASRTGEWRGGIGRLDPEAAPPAARDLLAPYLDAVGPRDGAGMPASYPGSPAMAQRLLRDGDRMTLCELHPADAGTLRAAMGRDKRVKVVRLDGYTALKAFVPPPERRGVVLVDPPFETPDEFERLANGLSAAHRRWPTGIYMLWYPLKDRAGIKRFVDALARSGIPRILQVHLAVDDITASGEGPLGGCGLGIVNPPFGFEDELGVLMPFLAHALGRDGRGSWSGRMLAGEAGAHGPGLARDR